MPRSAASSARSDHDEPPTASGASSPEPRTRKRKAVSKQDGPDSARKKTPRQPKPLDLTGMSQWSLNSLWKQALELHPEAEPEQPLPPGPEMSRTCLRLPVKSDLIPALLKVADEYPDFDDILCEQKKWATTCPLKFDKEVQQAHRAMQVTAINSHPYTVYTAKEAQRDVLKRVDWIHGKVMKTGLGSKPRSRINGINALTKIAHMALEAEGDDEDELHKGIFCHKDGPVWATFWILEQMDKDFQDPLEASPRELHSEALKHGINIYERVLEWNWPTKQSSGTSLFDRWNTFIQANDQDSDGQKAASPPVLQS